MKKCGIYCCFKIFTQCFLTWGNFDPWGDIWWYLEKFVCHSGGYYCYLVHRDQSVANKQGNSYDKEYLAQRVDSAQVKKIC